MVEVGPFQVNQVRTWLGSKFDDASRWRQKKAEEYPDDARNSRSARVLEAAARYVRTVDHAKSPGLVRITRFVVIANESGVDLLAPAFALAPLPGFETQRVTNRLGFDTSTDAADELLFEEFLRDLADAAVRDLRERLFELDKDSPLARLIRSETTPVTPEDASAQSLSDLVEIVGALRDDSARENRLRIIESVSNLVAKVRDVAIEEAGEGWSVQAGETFPQTRMQLGIAVKIYMAASGRELAACSGLATDSSLTSKMSVIGGATNAFEELRREAEHQHLSAWGTA